MTDTPAAAPDQPVDDGVSEEHPRESTAGDTVDPAGTEAAEAAPQGAVTGPDAARHPMTGNLMTSDPDAEPHGFETHDYDVIVIGAGGAGLRAAIAAHDAGARTALVC